MDTFARSYLRLSHRDQVEQGFEQQNKVFFQASVPSSEVLPGKLYRITVPFYPTAYVFWGGTGVGTGDRLPEHRDNHWSDAS